MVALHHAPSGLLWRLWLLCCGGCLLLSSLPTLSQAQRITLDGSLGPAGALGGPNYVIPSFAGQTHGPNLFHSFGQFNLLGGESATFTNTGPGAITNIVGRVTGGSPSVIDGLIRSQIAGANLYLLNPRGVLFGPNASLDISGSFHVSTADYLRFADGEQFFTHLDPRLTSTLSVASPVAFGFLTPTPAPIGIAGSTLQVPHGQTLSIIGGDIERPFVPPEAVVPATLAAPGGQVNLVSVASPGEVGLTPTVSLQNFTALGQIKLLGGSLINASGNASSPQGGTVVIRGGRLLIDNAVIAADTIGNIDGARTGIDIATTQEVVLTNRAGLGTTARGAGRAGDIAVRGGSVEISNGASITAQTVHGSAGGSGSIAIATPQLHLSSGLIRAATAGDGPAGDVTVEVGALSLLQGGRVSSNSGIADTNGTVLAGTGAAGTVTISATTSAFLTQGSQITAATFGGVGGRIRLTTPRLTLEDGAALNASTGSNAPAGDIIVEVGQLTLARNAGFFSTSGVPDPRGNILVGTGASGNVTVSAMTSASLTQGSQISTTTFGGSGGQVTMTTPSLTLDGGLLGTSTGGDARAGDIVVEVGTLMLKGGGGLLSNSGLLDPRVNQRVGRGAAGNVRVTATELMMENGFIQAGTAGRGNAGDVAIDVERGTFASSQIDSTTFGSTGQGGRVTIRAAESLSVTASLLSSATTGPGNAGTVSVSTPNLLLNSGRVQASTSGDGNAGNVVVEAGQLTLRQQSVFSSSSGTFDPLGRPQVGTGRAGDVTVTAKNAIALSENSGITSQTFGSGAGGNVTVTAPRLSLQNATLIASTGGDGPAGNITVGVEEVTIAGGGGFFSTGGALDRAGNLHVGTGAAGNITMRATTSASLTDRGQLSTTTFGGPGGRITVQTPHLILDGGAIQTATGGNSRAGDIVVEVDQLTIRGAQRGLFSASGALDLTGQSRVGTGAAGDIAVTATTAVSLSNQGVISAQTLGSGAGGNIRVVTPSLTLVNGGGITAGTSGNGRAGDIALEVGRLILMQDAQINSLSGLLDGAGNLHVGAGDAGNVTVVATTAISLSERSQISLQTHGGTGGHVTLTTPNVSLEQASLITTATGGERRAGNIAVHADSVLLLGGSMLSSTSGIFQPGGPLRVGTGAAGSVVLDAGQLALHGGALIVSATFGSGPGGMVSLTARDTLAITGQSQTGIPSGVSSQTFGAGAAGNVTLIAPGVIMDGGAIAASTGGAGRAGDIRIDVGQIAVQGGTIITSSTSGKGAGGTVLLTARDTVTITGQSQAGVPSAIASVAFGEGIAGRVTISTPTLTMDGGLISAAAFGAGRAGDIVVEAGQMTMKNGAQIESNTTGSGHGGTVTINATEALAITGRDSAGSILSGIFSQTVGPGDAGAVLVSTPRLTIGHGGQIGADTGGDGGAGDVLVQVGSMSLESGAQIKSGSGIDTAGTLRVGTGQGGTVFVTATDTVIIAGQESGLSTRTAGRGQGGDVTLQARQVQLTDGANISAQGASAGDAGSVTITAGEAFQSANSAVTTTANTGAGGVITITAGTAIDLTATDIAATVTGGSQPGGSMTLTTPTLTIMGGRLASETQGAGNAGNVTLNVGQLMATAQATLTSSSTGTAAGAAGSVTIHGVDGTSAATTVLLTDSTLRTSAENTGAGGAILVAAREALTLDQTTLAATVNNGLDTPGAPRGDITLKTPTLTLVGAHLEAETTGTRRAGDITLNIGSLVAQEATLTSSSTGTALGNAGTVTMQGLGGTGTTATRLMFTGSIVATEASVADGGDIQVLAQDTLRLQDSRITTAVRSGTGRGGNILIDPEFVILERSQIVADAFGGPGGNIRLVATGFLADVASRVSASSAQNVDGIIDIQAVTNPIGLVTPLPLDFAPVVTLLSSRCATRLRAGMPSSLVVVRRDGVPPEPEGGLPSLPVVGDLEPAAALVPSPVLRHVLTALPSGGLQAPEPLHLLGSPPAPGAWMVFYNRCR